MYESGVSREALATIQTAEANPEPTNKTGRRFRRLFNEIEALRLRLDSLGNRLSSSEESRVKLGYRGGWGR
jgi:hypothetical protein